MRLESSRSQVRGLSPNAGRALLSKLGSIPTYLLSPKFTPLDGRMQRRQLHSDTKLSEGVGAENRIQATLLGTIIRTMP
jgi:hypothetical protein